MPIWGFVLAVIGIGAVTSIFLVTLSAYDVAVRADVPKDRVFKINETNEPPEAVKMREENDAWLASQHFEELTMTASDGKKLFARILPAREASDKWAVVIHGFGGNGLHHGTAARHFYNMGYNIFLPDLRGSGNSEGEYLGMGWLDAVDMKAWLAQIVDRNPKACILLYGGSMGGATVMMLTGHNLPPQVKVAVEDCGYTSVWDIFRYQLKKVFNLGKFPWLVLGDRLSPRLAGYTFKEASSVNQLKKSTTPTLFIHGTDDHFVPFWMLDKNYEAANVPKKKLVIEGARHNKSMFTNPELYWSTVDDFIKPYMDGSASSEKSGAD